MRIRSAPRTPNAGSTTVANTIGAGEGDADGVAEVDDDCEVEVGVTVALNVVREVMVVVRTLAFGGRVVVVKMLVLVVSDKEGEGD